MIQKSPRHVDKAWTSRARDLTYCEACGQSGDLVACHLRQNDRLGTCGTAMKPDDWFVVYCCAECHWILDGEKCGTRDFLIMVLLRQLCLDRYMRITNE